MSEEALDTLERMAAGDGALKLSKQLLRALIDKARKAERQAA